MSNATEEPAVTVERVPDVATQARYSGQRLRDRRKSLGISMTAAAEAAGMSRVTWHRLERGETSVAWGYVLAAVHALGLEVEIEVPGAASTASAPSDLPALPLTIRLSDYAQLQRLAWQVGDGATILSPREALALYERNRRHLDIAALASGERALIDALSQVFDVDVLGV
ncbi:helix-turn-helix transcriptional regulator [Luteimonas sp. TWI1415]|uniref:helix-turn-helix domain-containing protein n=1 Tax=Luteimonas sp. TWI1415 TaxID=3136801 RepID=UPI00320AF81E